jgi:lipoprotein-anchoring transpeptidase ErfK/SrfK
MLALVSSRASISALVILAACARAHPDPSVRSEPSTTESADGGAAAAVQAPTTTSADIDGGVPAEPPPDGIFVYATAFIAPIFSASEWPARDASQASEERKNVVRLGYLRHGTRVVAKKDVIKKKNCDEGWYALAQGGFVCGKYATTDAKAKELEKAPHAPFTDRPLPYDYGLNLTPGTPLYRRLPLRAERKENEKALAIGKGAKATDVAKRLKENGEEVPAYLKDVDNAKPHVGFDELKGESGLVVQRMLRGFYLSVDKKVDGFSGTFWKTTEGFFAPKDHLIIHEMKTEFEGIDLTKEGETRKLPIAWIVGTRGRKCEIDLNADKKVKRHDLLDRFSTHHLTGKHQTIDERVYWETDEGFWLRDIDIAIARPTKPPADLAANEKWIDVDLLHESLTAYEGEKPVFTTIVSTGRHNTDPAKDHRTVEGSFRIREKHISTTMDDDAASDGTYRIEDVPWVMYFEKSVALHGAFWHSMFGRERSHGCVNLQPADAHRIFDWVGPSIPAGWHGIRASKENPGTRVITHR